ncbi:hypothetical protein KAR04_04230 [Candidatus Calescamantes bacterium]|nr:hypothetical protein [Candidatus Calescamantes bacterium]
MKRNLLVLVIISLALFGGCSEKADLQTFPLTGNSGEGIYSSHSSTSIEDVVIPILIKKEYYNELFIENYDSLPSKMYFINSILAAYMNNSIYFMDINQGKRFINQLESISISFAQSNEENIEGIMKRLMALSKNIPEESNAIHTSVIEAIILLTNAILGESQELVFIVPAGLNSWNDIVSFFYDSETQAIITSILIVLVVGIFLKGCNTEQDGYVSWNKRRNSTCWSSCVVAARRVGGLDCSELIKNYIRCVEGGSTYDDGRPGTVLSQDLDCLSDKY